jgi:hypothetical protein
MGKKGSGQRKGSSFERAICKRLSLWWTNDKRDDIFWRTSGSGARATTRSKQGRSTKNQYGDVQAVDPIGQPLIDLCAIELKKGYGHHSYYDLFDGLDCETNAVYKRFIKQAQGQQAEAGTFAWLLITARDRKKTMIAMPIDLKRLLMNVNGVPEGCYPQMNLRLCISYQDYVDRIFVTTFDEFIRNVDPKCFIQAATWYVKDTKTEDA